MNSYKIYLNDIKKVIAFVKAADSLDCRLELTSGNYVVDGKSIMGIFALDLSKAIDVKVIFDNHEPVDCSGVLDDFLI